MKPMKKQLPTIHTKAYLTIILCGTWNLSQRFPKFGKYLMLLIKQFMCEFLGFLAVQLKSSFSRIWHFVPR